jgi:hypothetical protein
MAPSPGLAEKGWCRIGFHFPTLGVRGPSASAVCLGLSISGPVPMPGCPAVAVKVFGAGDSDDPDVSTPRAAPEDSRSPGGSGSGSRLDRQKGFQQLVQNERRLSFMSSFFLLRHRHWALSAINGGHGCLQWRRTGAWLWFREALVFSCMIRYAKKNLSSSRSVRFSGFSRPDRQKQRRARGNLCARVRTCGGRWR